MDQDLLFKSFQEFESKLSRLDYAMNLIEWDAATYAPKGGLAYRAKVIGGLNRDNIVVLAGIPIAGICVVSAIMKADDPRQAAASLMEKARELGLY